ncbi:hypothetical protein V7201_01585 [Bacillus sp. JJ1122]
MIVVEGTKTPPKMLTHFHRAWAGSRKQINVLRAQRQPRGKRSAWNENQQPCLTEP